MTDIDFFLFSLYNKSMNREILEKISRLSPEEKQILYNQKKISMDDYTSSEKFIVNSKKLLTGDKQIDLRLHTRFIDFPEHSHDYMRSCTYVRAASHT